MMEFELLDRDGFYRALDKRQVCNVTRDFQTSPNSVTLPFDPRRTYYLTPILGFFTDSWLERLRPEFSEWIAERPRSVHLMSFHFQSRRYIGIAFADDREAVEYQLRFG